METVLSVSPEMQLDSGERELMITLRRLPKVTQLLQNYPNPFNPETWIPFQLSQDAEVRLTIYDVTGKTVRKMELGHLTAGSYSQTERAIYWDEETETGEALSSGTYFYRLQAGNYA